MIRLDRTIRSKHRAAKDGPVKPDRDGKGKVISLDLIGKYPNGNPFRSVFGRIFASGTGYFLSFFVPSCLCGEILRTLNKNGPGSLPMTEKREKISPQRHEGTKKKSTTFLTKPTM